MKVVILGASPKKDRYSHKALIALKSHGHEPILVNPAYPEIDGMPCHPSLESISPTAVDTLTLYMDPSRSAPLEAAIIKLKPRRVVFNPGAESPFLESKLKSAGILTENACTLVMLATGQF